MIVTVAIIGIMRTTFTRRPLRMMLKYLVFIIAASFIPMILRQPAISEHNPLEAHIWLLIIMIVPIIITCRKEFQRKNKYFLPVLTSLVISIIIIFSVDFIFDNILQPHHRDRIENLLGISEDLKGAGYNVNQSRIAIGSGGLAGKGFLNGTQTKFNFVPEQSTDFIFCTIGEEWGFVGSFIVIAIFFTMIFTIIHSAERQKDKFTRIFGYCIASYLFMHVFVNIGMTIGIMPVVGIPLPLISYGGSSFITFTILLFIYIKLDFDKWN
jgi:rod shape determining protein RodA